MLPSCIDTIIHIHTCIHAHTHTYNTSTCIYAYTSAYVYRMNIYMHVHIHAHRHTQRQAPRNRHRNRQTQTRTNSLFSVNASRLVSSCHSLACLIESCARRSYMRTIFKAQAAAIIAVGTGHQQHGKQCGTHLWGIVWLFQALSTHRMVSRANLQHTCPARFREIETRKQRCCSTDPSNTRAS